MTQPRLHDRVRIRRKRIEAGLSMPALAALSGVSLSHLSQVEAGKCGISPTYLAKIAEAIGCGIADLLIPEDGEDEPSAEVA